MLFGCVKGKTSTLSDQISMGLCAIKQNSRR